jgi:hypothetical protein
LYPIPESGRRAGRSGRDFPEGHGSQAYKVLVSVHARIEGIPEGFGISVLPAGECRKSAAWLRGTGSLIGLTGGRSACWPRASFWRVPMRNLLCPGAASCAVKPALPPKGTVFEPENAWNPKRLNNWKLLRRVRLGRPRGVNFELAPRNSHFLTSSPRSRGTTTGLEADLNTVRTGESHS